MIYIFKGRQRQYKTTTMVGAVLWYVLNGGYKTSEIYSNVRLYHDNGEELTEYHYLNIALMRQFVREMVERGYTHKLIVIDEIDRVFPHRFWNKYQQTEALLGLWQDEKLFNIVFGTTHVGKGIDLILRECMQFEIFTKYDKRRRAVKLVVIDNLNRKIIRSSMVNISLVQKLFNSWQPIK
jgi:hypothetical protein